MKIYIDGAVLQQPATGIAKTLLFLYENCHRIEPSLKIEIMHRLSLKCKLPPYISSSKILPYSPEFFWRKLLLPAYIAGSKPDFVHFPWNGNIPSFLTNTKIISTIHDVLPLEIPGYFMHSGDKRLYLRKTQDTINKSDLIITVSEYSKDQIIKNFDVKEDPIVIYHGPTLELNSIKTVENEEKGYFLYVGGYDPRKGIDILLKTFIKLYEENKIKSMLVLTGSKNYFSDEFKNLVGKGIEYGIVEEKGYVSDSELTQLYLNALALIYPSKYEGFGLPPLEAMKMGCPVITTRCTSIPEVGGDAAYYIDVDNPKEMEQALIYLENDESLRKKLKNKGKKQAENFSWISSAKLFLKEINEIL